MLDVEHLHMDLVGQVFHFCVMLLHSEIMQRTGLLSWFMCELICVLRDYIGNLLSGLSIPRFFLDVFENLRGGTCHGYMCAAIQCQTSKELCQGLVCYGYAMNPYVSSLYSFGSS